MPSLRLFTSPAWLTLDRLRSVSEVRAEDLALVGQRGLVTGVAVELAPRGRRRCRVSRTASADSDEARYDEDDAQVERLRPQPVVRRRCQPVASALPATAK